MPERAILHIDMDAFYASVEVLDNPELRGRPVIVGGTPEGRGVVSAASYEARRFGVHSAMPAARARRICPDGVFLRGRMDRYVEVSREIRSVFHDFTDLVEPLSLDEAFLDVTGSRRLFGSSEQIGHTIKDRILDEIGLVASVGVAHNKFLAKLGSDMDKPDGFYVFHPETAEEILAQLPVGRLWGVGKVSQARLGELGIRKVADLLAIAPAVLRSTLGDHTQHLLALARGQDDRPVIPHQPAKSMGHEVTFSEDVADLDRLNECLDEMSAKVGRRLRRHGFLARRLTLKARYGDFTTKTRSVTLPEPSDSTVVIRDCARRLLAEKLGRRGRALRLIGITAGGLEVGAARPPELFVDQEKSRDQKLDKLLDEVQGRFGDSAIKRGARRFDRDDNRESENGEDRQ